MKRLLALLLLTVAASSAFAYPKMPLVERFTNASCGPCAVLNNGWYTDTVDQLEEDGQLNHIVYNVNWPGPLDPMYLFNATDNMVRRGYYLVNAVPWIEIDGTQFNYSGNHAVDEANFTNAVTVEAAEYAPLSIELAAAIYANDVIDVAVTITRDPSDATVLPETLTLHVALLENMVSFASPPGSNGERDFPDVCRKMLPDALGVTVPVPAAGESYETSVLYTPTAEAQSTIDFAQTRILAFLQDDATQDVLQSIKVPTAFTDLIHAAFRADETIGATPMTVVFEDLSTPASGSPIVTWAWDFDSDGTVDSTDPSPTWTYTAPGTYSVTLTVGDGQDTHTIVREDFIRAITHVADILVVNGLEYATYGAEMEAFYDGSAVFGSHQVDVWDLFGDQGFAWEANPSISQAIELRDGIPDSVLDLYRTVIWVGNNFGGDLDFWDPAQVLAYVQDGGNFVLATRYGGNYLNTALRQYAGITSVSGDRTVAQLEALDPNLVNMPSVGANSLVHLVALGAASEAVPIFRDPAAPSYTAGFRLQKEGDGTFVYVAGRPYRYDTEASYQNYDYMLANWMSGATAIGDGLPAARELTLAPAQPNPFNPSTQLRFTLPRTGHVSLKVYDAAGRLVRTLVDEVRPAAEHVATWDGRDDAGATVAAGVYLCQVQTPGASDARRVVLVK